MKKIIKVLLLTIFIGNIMFVNTLAHENHEKTVVKSDKIWTITFNNTVHNNILDNIIVKDSKDNIINVSVEIKEENKVLIYPPEGGYIPLEDYCIVINKTPNGLKKEFLFEFKVLNEIKSIGEVWKFVDHNEKYVLPEEVEAKLINEEKVNVPVLWEKEAVTNETGIFYYRGKVKGLEKEVTLKLFVLPKVISVKDIDVNMYVGDDYCLPEKVKVQYSDGTNGMKKVNWINNNLDIITVGEYACEGEIEGFDGVVKARITVKSNFLLNYIYPGENEKNVELKFGYISLEFSKDTVRSYEVDKIILKDENGVRIKIKEAAPVIDYKDNFLIVPWRVLEHKTKYTLFVPKGIIKSIDGEIYEEDIKVTFTTK